jgi:hypothetical protein
MNPLDKVHRESIMGKYDALIEQIAEKKATVEQIDPAQEYLRIQYWIEIDLLTQSADYLRNCIIENRINY